jgi:hypothetical protein
MTQRLSQEFVEQKFQEAGCELLDAYRGRHTPVRFRCSCGNISTITYGSLCRGSRCLECSGKRKYNLKETKTYIEQQGYSLISTEYRGAFVDLETRCSEGHTYITNWNKFQQGCRCMICANKSIADKLRLNHETVSRAFTDAGCELLSDSYIGNQHKLKYRCDCGKISHITYGNFQQGQRCKDCGKKKQSGENHHNWIKDREKARLNRLFSAKCRTALRNTLNATNTKKTSKTFGMIGYSADILRKYIINHSNWERVKNSKWHLDHIFPVKAFCDYGISDIALINCLENLQPLEGRENLRKHDKYNKKEFEAWLATKGYTFSHT